MGLINLGFYSFADRFKKKHAEPTQKKPQKSEKIAD